MFLNTAFSLLSEIIGNIVFIWRGINTGAQYENAI